MQGAGHPESWFRRQDELEFAARWGIADASEGTFGYSDYFRAAAAAGSTDNRVFAARIMWGTLDEVTAHLAHVYPGHAGSAAGLLSAAFGRMRFVYLRRGDVAAQAVSLLRAEQTGVWFETADERQEPTAEPGFDFGQARDLVRQIENENAPPPARRGLVRGAAGCGLPLLERPSPDRVEGLPRRWRAGGRTCSPRPAAHPVATARSRDGHEDQPGRSGPCLKHRGEVSPPKG